MPKSPTNFYQPHDLLTALELLRHPHTFPLGGGTKLLAQDVPGAVVDLQWVGLNQIYWETDQLHIGATVRLTDIDLALATADNGRFPAPLLRQAIHQAGPNTYRNAATLGGSIASRLPDSELLATLLALTATLTLYTPDATTLSLAEYLEAPERPFGLITQIHVPWTAGQGQAERVARTPADTPIVSVILWQPEGEAPRLAATGIGARPCRLYRAETILAQGRDQDALNQTAAAAHSATRHPGDFRGDTAYRADIVAILTRRVCLAK